MQLRSTSTRVYAVGLACLAAALGALAGMQPAYAVAVPLAILFAGLVFADLAYGLAIFTVTAFMETLPSLFGGLSFAKAVGLLLVLSWFAVLVVTERRSRDLAAEHPYFTAVLILMTAWVASSALWAEAPTDALGGAVTWGLNLMLFPIAFAAVTKRSHLELVFSIIALGTLFSALAAATGLLESGGSAADADRLSGAGINPNQLGGLLLIGTVFAGALAARREPAVPVRAGWFTVALLSGGMLAFTLSRGALLGMVVALLAAPFLVGRGRRLPVLMAGACVAGAVALSVVALVPGEAAARLTSSDQTGSGRTDIWRVGMRMVADRPVLGVGANNFRHRTIDYLLQPGAIRHDEYIVDLPKVPHNIYLQVLAELGAVGLALFAALLTFTVLAPLRAARNFARDGRRSDEILARGLAIALVGFLAAEFFSSQLYSKALWLMLALGPAVLALSQRPQRHGVPAA